MIKVKIHGKEKTINMIVEINLKMSPLIIISVNQQNRFFKELHKNIFKFQVHAI